TKKADGAVNWLVLADANVDAFVDEDEETFDDEPGKGSDPTTRTLCTGCGLLGAAGTARCDTAQCTGGPMLTVREHPRAKRVMTRCTECGAQSRQGIRRLRTDANAAPAVVTTALYQQLPEAVGETADQVGSGRKLLMFSDSRQGAAFAAPYLNRTYSRLLERRYMAQSLRQAGRGEQLTTGDLAILTREHAQAAGA
ncbi:DEAD/DEAH box helicase, partial [Mycobacterium sp. ITM-2017-0098]